MKVIPCIMECISGKICTDTFASLAEGDDPMRSAAISWDELRLDGFGHGTKGHIYILMTCAHLEERNLVKQGQREMGEPSSFHDAILIGPRAICEGIANNSLTNLYSSFPIEFAAK